MSLRRRMQKLDSCEKTFALCVASDYGGHFKRLPGKAQYFVFDRRSNGNLGTNEGCSGRGRAYVFSPEDHDIDAYYLLYSPGLGPNPGPTGPIGPAVRLLKLTYDNENRVATITIQRYIPQTGSTVHREGNHSESWYLVVRLRGLMESFRVMTDEGEEIPVQVIR